MWLHDAAATYRRDHSQLRTQQRELAGAGKVQFLSCASPPHVSAELDAKCCIRQNERSKPLAEWEEPNQSPGLPTRCWIHQRPLLQNACTCSANPLIDVPVSVSLLLDVAVGCDTGMHFLYTFREDHDRLSRVSKHLDLGVRKLQTQVLDTLNRLGPWPHGRCCSAARYS